MEKPAIDAPQNGQNAALPRDAQEAIRVATALGLTIPADCLPGVTANLELLRHHAAIFHGTSE